MASLSNPAMQVIIEIIHLPDHNNGGNDQTLGNDELENDQRPAKGYAFIAADGQVAFKGFNRIETRE